MFLNVISIKMQNFLKTCVVNLSLTKSAQRAKKSVKKNHQLVLVDEF